MEFTGPYRFRLTIGLPLVVICFTLAAGFIPLNLMDYNIRHIERPYDLSGTIFPLKVAVLGIAAVAAVLSILMSKYIVRPIERMIREIETFAAAQGKPLSDSGQDNGKTDDEIDRLSRVYKETFVPMRGYLTTADLFLQMSEGIVSLDAEGKVAFLNAPMERLLGIQREKYIGKHYADLFPNPARNNEIHEVINDVLHEKITRTRD